MKKINQLPEATTANNSDILAIQTTEGITKQITRELFLEGISSGSGGGSIADTDPYEISVIFRSNFNNLLTDDKGHVLTNFGTTFNTDAKHGSHSLAFNGSSYFQIIAKSSDEFRFLHNGSNFTLEFWIKSATGTTKTILDTTAGASANIGVWFALQPDNTLRYFATRAWTGNPSLNLITSLAIPNNVWSFVSVISENGTLKIYIDGQLAGSQAWSGASGANPSFTNPLIGTWNNNNGADFFIGLIDSMRITPNIVRDGSIVPDKEFANSSSDLLLPTSFSHWHDESIIVSGASVTRALVNSYLYNIEIYQEPPAINDSFKFSKVLQAGNYRLGILTATKSNLGRLKLDINNVLAFDDLDCYSAGQNLNAYIYRDIVIASPGLQEFKFTVYTKNSSASNYYFSGRKFWAYKL